MGFSHLLNGGFPTFPLTNIFACGCVRHFIASLEKHQPSKEANKWQSCVLLSQLSNLRDHPQTLKCRLDFSPPRLASAEHYCSLRLSHALRCCSLRKSHALRSLAALHLEHGDVRVLLRTIKSPPPQQAYQAHSPAPPDRHPSFCLDPPLPLHPHLPPPLSHLSLDLDKY